MSVKVLDRLVSSTRVDVSLGRWADDAAAELRFEPLRDEIMRIAKRAAQSALAESPRPAPTPVMRAAPIGSAQRMVRTPFGSWCVEDDAFAAEIERVAFSQDPVMMSRVDALVRPHERQQKAARLIAAERLVRCERPDLVRGAGL